MNTSNVSAFVNDCLLRRSSSSLGLRSEKPPADSRAPAGVWVDRGSAACGGATEREKKRGEHHTRDVPARLWRREPPATHARRAHRARIARCDARWRGPVPHEATTKDKARDKDHDRRQKKRSTTARSLSTAAARTTHTCAARRQRACASASPRPSRSTRRRAKREEESPCVLFVQGGGQQTTDSQTTTPLRRVE